MIRNPIYGAASRRSTRCHVIQYHQRRFDSSGIPDPSLPRDNLNGPRIQRGPSRDKAPLYGASVEPVGQLLGRRQKSSDTSSRGVKLPTFEEAPSFMKGCYFNGELTSPSALRGTPWVEENVKSVTVIDGEKHSPIHRHHLSITPDGFQKIDILGEGPTKKIARSAAYTRLIANLYSNGLLDKVWHQSKDGRHPVKTEDSTRNETHRSADGQPPVESPDLLNTDSARQHKQAFIEVYHYCASYGLVPKVTLTREQTVSDSSSNSHPTSVLRVELPEHHIFVAVKATPIECRLQELTAAAEFNKKAEEYRQSENPKTQKSAYPLNVGNAEQFVKFCAGDKAFATLEQDGRFNTVRITMDGSEWGYGLSVSIKRARKVAWLAAAIHAANIYPRRLAHYSRSLTPTSDADVTLSAPKLPRHLDVDISQENLRLIQRSLDTARADGLFSENKDLGPREEPPKFRNWVLNGGLSLDRSKERSRHLLDVFREYTERDDLEGIRKARAMLPISQHSGKVLDLVSNNIYSIIIGATGSGKSTQVPQIILDHFMRTGNGGACNIICTQPRRIAAISVSKRVAEERDQQLQDQVGYRIRFDDKTPKTGGSITYCTTGILLQYLQHAPDFVFNTVSHLIIDEVHVRDKLIDFLLVVLKKTVFERLKSGKSVPRIVLMSATMDSNQFASYFEMDDPEVGTVKCPSLVVPGRTFPVKEQYLDSILETFADVYGRQKLLDICKEQTTKEFLEVEGRLTATALPQNFDADAEEEEVPPITPSEKEEAGRGPSRADQVKSEQVPFALVVNTVFHIAATSKNGAILVFLPGLETMLKVQSMLEEHPFFGVNFRNQTKYRVFLLHSSLPDSQKSVFQPLPKGCRKIILATNIAETSITIPEVQYVVDAGKHREYTYDQITQVGELSCTWISKSNSKQRAGRAGRVQNGHYYALFFKKRFEMFRAVGVPELHRVDLQETCLSIKAQALQAPIRDFLADTIEPPSTAAIDAAIAGLKGLGALTEHEDITPLGRLLESLPVHPSLGKMILLGVIYRCLDPMIIIGAAAGDRGLFTLPVGYRRAADAAREEFTAGSQSDHIALLNAFTQLRDIQLMQGDTTMCAYADKTFLHTGAYYNITAIAHQIEEVLEAARLIPTNNQRRGTCYGVPSLNENSSNEGLIKSLLVAGLYPRIASRRSWNFYDTPSGPATGSLVHPASVNHTVGRPRSGTQSWRQRQRLLAYTAIALTGEGDAHFLRNTTDVSPLMVALFGGPLTYPPANNQKGNDDTANPTDTGMDAGTGTKTDTDSESTLLASGARAPFHVLRGTPLILAFREALRAMEDRAFHRLSNRKLGAGNQALVDAVVSLLASDALDREMRAIELELEINRLSRREDLDDGPEEGDDDDEMLVKMVEGWRRKKQDAA